MAKARVVVGDQNSAEFDALRRSFNSLLVVLERIASEVDATTLTAVEGFSALEAALTNGVDASGTPAAHVGTGRQVVGVKPTPLHPARRAEEVVKLVDMAAADKF
ncbi:hypothetical protein HC928_00350 [bacterium]|nr:hypothetical protein [bacterium]